MTAEQFKVIFESRLEKIRQIEEIKGKQYSRGGDRFSHFKDEGDIIPELSLWYMWHKHITYTKYIIEDIEQGILPSEKQLNEITTDMMIYPAILEGLIFERIHNREETKNE
ncbi:MAG: hypothetical protein WA066_02910 [Candidatus Omnitrophota bacterium]